MYKIDNTEFRNLEEQVQKNKEDIANHYAIDRALSNLGIEVVGQVSTPADLPDPSTYEGVYGDTYAVGVKANVDAGTASYDYYVWTRPDPNSGHPDAYWLNVGKISIVGPQGPQGPRGERGLRGENSTWYTGTTYPTSANKGDMYLNNQGYIYQYNGTTWNQITNIRGSQGPQGTQGIQGPPGEQGPQGPQGLRGDVGGLVNIAGILDSTDLLPTPAEVNNVTIAYLINNQTYNLYDLWIQIGLTPQDSVWTNVGPINVATMVTIDGIYQNIWDADTKLDKVTKAGAARLYSVSGDGRTQSTVNYGSNNSAYWVAYRDANANFFVGDPVLGGPFSGKYCVNVDYMNANSPTTVTLTIKDESWYGKGSYFQFEIAMPNKPKTTQEVADYITENYIDYINEFGNSFNRLLQPGVLFSTGQWDLEFPSSVRKMGHALAYPTSAPTNASNEEKTFTMGFKIRVSDMIGIETMNDVTPTLSQQEDRILPSCTVNVSW